MAAVGEAKGLICEGVDGVVDAVEAEIRSLRRRGPRLVILYDRANEPTYERLLAHGLLRGHTHNSGRRSLEVLARVDVADPLRYLFVNTGIGDRALEPFAVLCFQRDAILQVPRTGARRCLIVLTRSVLNEFRRRPLGVFDQLWGFQQRPGFQVMKQFGLNALVLLGEKVRWPDALAFPDMRALPDGGERRRMLSALLAWGQQPPCGNCGAVLPRWANGNLCCRGLEAQVAAQLPPHMPEQMLTSIKRETRRNANFPRIVNRDMRPALQNASVGAPGGGGHVW
jgi:hypothetical protein